MRTFRTLLAIIFSLLIVWWIWKYYTSNDHVWVQDPFAAVWSKFASYKVEDTTKKNIEEPAKEIEVVLDDSGVLNKDFTFGEVSAEEIERLTALWVLWWNPNWNILWLQYCDFDAEYCQESFDKWIVYDYLEAYPSQLQYIFKPFPVGNNEAAMLPHQATMCAMDLWTSKQYFGLYNSLYANASARGSLDALIVLWRELWINNFDDCMENTNYDLVLQQETKFAKNTFDLKALPANIFINKTTWNWVLVPGYYETEEVLPAIGAIK